ncbi:MAG: hypothetical protein U1E87_03540 [Alphaproteobacteria bacterium]
MTVVAAYFGLASCASTPPRIASEVSIRIDRFLVIAEQEIRAIALVADRPDYSAVYQRVEGPETPRTLYAKLYVAVALQSSIQRDACGMGLLDPALCARYRPAWLVPPSQARPTPEMLDSWSAEAQNAILPLWHALCAKAIEKAQDPTFCAIE